MQICFFFFFLLVGWLVSRSLCKIKYRLGKIRAIKRFILEVFCGMFKSHVLLMQDLGLCISLSFLICCLKWPSNCSPSVIVIGWLSSRHNEVISLCRGCSCTSHCIELFFLAIHIPMFSAGVCHWSWLVLTPILKPKITSNPVHTD